MNAPRGTSRISAAYPDRMRVFTGRLCIMAAWFAMFCAITGAFCGGSPKAYAVVKTVPLESRSHRHAAIITINDPVDQITYTSLKRRIIIARKAADSLLILRINSTGGYPGPALASARLIRHAGLPTVAYISGSALGPSLLLAAACNKIVMAPKAMFGDGGNMAGNKSVIADVRKDSARGHPLLILRAMVDRRLQLDEVENQRTGRRRFLTPLQRRALFAPLRHKANTPSSQPAASWRFVRRVKQRGTLLTVDARQARRMGLSSATIRNRLQLRTQLRITGAKIAVLRLDMLEHLARWLATPTVRFFLFVIMLVCGYMEFVHPGITIPGGIALLALALLLGGPLITGLANWLDLLIVAVGIAIILFDLLHFGGIGLLAVPGLLLVAAGIVATFIPPGAGSPGSSTSLQALRTGMTVTVLGMVTGGGIILLLMRYFKITPGLRRFALAPGIAPNIISVYARNTNQRDTLFPGAIGRAMTDLRPAGKARFGENLVDVMAENEYISANAVITISSLHENRIWVKPTPDGS